MERTHLDPRRWLALALLCAAQFIVILDTSIIGVALPAIQTQLGFSPGGLQLDLQRLCHCLRRPAPAGRSSQRSLRRPAHLHHRLRHPHRRIAACRPRQQPGIAAGRPGIAGDRRRADRSGGPDHRDAPLRSQWCRTRQGLRSLGRCRSCGRLGWRVPRGRDHRVAGLALGPSSSTYRWACWCWP